MRIRTLIGQQVGKIEEERAIIEKRTQDQIKQLKNDLNHQLEEVGSMTAKLDKTNRVIKELKKQLEDKDDIISQVRDDTEKRVGALQLELVEATSERQNKERELNSCQLQLERTQGEYKNEVT